MYQSLYVPGSNGKHQSLLLENGVGAEGPRHRHDHQPHRTGDCSDDHDHDDDDFDDDGDDDGGGGGGCGGGCGSCGQL